MTWVKYAPGGRGDMILKWALAGLSRTVTIDYRLAKASGYPLSGNGTKLAFLSSRTTLSPCAAGGVPLSPGSPGQGELLGGRATVFSLPVRIPAGWLEALQDVRR